VKTDVGLNCKVNVAILKVHFSVNAFIENFRCIQKILPFQIPNNIKVISSLTFSMKRWSQQVVVSLEPTILHAL
jgi:hypothetical protein